MSINSKKLISLLGGIIFSLSTISAQKRLYMPVSGTISSNFGFRKLNKEVKFHSGIDIANNKYDTIYAAQKGIVTFSGVRNSAYGNTIDIFHDKYNLATRYAHLAKIFVKKKEKVKCTQPIGLVGKTGNVHAKPGNDPHYLHFEVWEKNKVVNPTKYLKDYSELAVGDKVKFKKYLPKLPSPKNYEEWITFLNNKEIIQEQKELLSFLEGKEIKILPLDNKISLENKIQQLSFINKNLVIDYKPYINIVNDVKGGIGGNTNLDFITRPITDINELDTTYSIQIAASAKPFSQIEKYILKENYGGRPVRIDKVPITKKGITKDYYKYSIGEFPTLKIAKKFKKLLSYEQEKYHPAINIFVNDKYLKTSWFFPDETEKIISDTLYAVQICASKNQMTDYTKKLSEKKYNHQIEEYKVNSNYCYCYVIGKSPDKKEVEQVRKSIKYDKKIFRPGLAIIINEELRKTIWK